MTKSASRSTAVQYGMGDLGGSDGPDDMAEVLTQMEAGSVMSRLYASRRKTDKKTIILRQDVFEIVWYGGSRGKTLPATPEGTGKAAVSVWAVCEFEFVERTGDPVAFASTRKH